MTEPLGFFLPPAAAAPLWKHRRNKKRQNSLVVTPLFHGCVESRMNGGRAAHSHHFLLLFYRFCEHNRPSAS